MNRLYEIKKKVFDYIKQYHLLTEKDTVVVGVSGGADSMCLLHLLTELLPEYDIRLLAVHVHHGIRGDEADGDMDYVQEFCEKNNIEFYGVKYDIPAIAKKEHLSEEEAGRLKRYEAFEEILREKSAGGGRIAVAHNMEDSCETFLFNLFRGTGLAGLTGIQPIRGNIIRPILCLTREEILFYLAGVGIAYRNDSTNGQTEYTRNKIRLELLPYIRENINEGAAKSIQRASNALGELERYMDRQAEAACEKYVRGDTEKGRILLQNELWQEEPVLIRLVIRKAVERATGRLKDITSRHIESIMELGSSQVSKSVHIPYQIRAVKTYDGVMLKQAETGSDKERRELGFTVEELLAGDGKLKLWTKNSSDENADGCLRFRIEKNKCIDLTENLYTKWMDYDILKGNLSVRSRRAGDYMVIGAGGQRKKLKELLIDLKIPREERDSLVLLAKGSEILWIVGFRMSESCKLKESTKEVIRVDYTDA